MDYREKSHLKWYESIDKRRMVAVVLDADENEVEVPVRYTVCFTCAGRGTHVHPSIDSHGISAEEWAENWDDESREMYLSGGFDVPCNECGGDRVTVELDRESADPAIVKLIDDRIQDWADYQAEIAAERRTGA